LTYGCTFAPPNSVDVEPPTEPVALNL
jgi:hypothetical protein